MAPSECPAQTAVSHHSAISTPLRPGIRLGRLINRMADRFAFVLNRRAQRRALAQLSDAQLSDIGISRAEAEEEYRKSFPFS